MLQDCQRRFVEGLRICHAFEGLNDCLRHSVSGSSLGRYIDQAYKNFVVMGQPQSLLSSKPHRATESVYKPPIKIVQFAVSGLSEDEEDSHALFRMLAKDSERSEYPMSSIVRQKTVVYSKLHLDRALVQAEDMSSCVTPPLKSYPKLIKPIAASARMSL
jgi:hypothetical protein